jgi:uracil-DNA glycosylase family 4
MKSDKLERLKNDIKFYYGNIEYVFSEGSLSPLLMLIGEAPGKDELLKGRPFVGKAGKNLDEFLEKVGIERSSIYISNVFKFGLRKLNKKSGRMINRPAKKDEIEKARTFLNREIEIINPKYIVTLGNTSLWAVTGNFKNTVGEMHGKITRMKIQDNTINLYPMYHPASIIYNRSLEQVYLKDIQKLSEIIG